MGQQVKKSAKRKKKMNSRNVVPFKSNEAITADLQQALLEKGKQSGLTAVLPFSVDKMILAEWVHLKCRYGCNKYNTNWCCPPATPRPEKARKIIDEYTTALLLVGTKSCADFYRNNERKRAAQVRCWKGTIALERMLFLEGYYKAFSLVGECCALCKACAYPEDCRFPQEKRPSVESFSIDVIGTLKNLGKTSRVETDTGATFNYYAIILVE
jgi:predicted metal-binding protein